jgi:hypothetical protein
MKKVGQRVSGRTKKTASKLMALLVYSDKCKWSADIMSFIKSQPALIEIVRFHNVNTNGVPSKKITRVPTLVTNEGQMLVGQEVKNWLVSMIPNDFDSWDGTGNLCSNLDGTENGCLFDIEKYGESLQPVMTPELEEKIAMNVTEAMQKSRT